MALNFPDSPSLNDTYSFAGRTWTWNGNAWSQTSTSLLGNIGESLIPTSDGVYDLGTSSKRWANLYVTGNTIILGTVALKDSNGSFVTSVAEANGYIVPAETAVGAGTANLLVFQRDDSTVNIIQEQGNITIEGRTTNTDITLTGS